MKFKHVFFAIVMGLSPVSYAEILVYAEEFYALLNERLGSQIEHANFSSFTGSSAACIYRLIDCVAYVNYMRNLRLLRIAKKLAKQTYKGRSFGDLNEDEKISIVDLLDGDPRLQQIFDKELARIREMKAVTLRTSLLQISKNAQTQHLLLNEKGKLDFRQPGYGLPGNYVEFTLDDIIKARDNNVGAEEFLAYTRIVAKNRIWAYQKAFSELPEVNFLQNLRKGIFLTTKSIRDIDELESRYILPDLHINLYYGPELTAIETANLGLEEEFGIEKSQSFLDRMSGKLSDKYPRAKFTDFAVEESRCEYAIIECIALVNYRHNQQVIPIADELASRYYSGKTFAQCSTAEQDILLSELENDSRVRDSLEAEIKDLNTIDIASFNTRFKNMRNSKVLYAQYIREQNKVEYRLPSYDLPRDFVPFTVDEFLEAKGEVDAPKFEVDAPKFVAYANVLAKNRLWARWRAFGENNPPEKVLKALKKNIKSRLRFIKTYQDLDQTYIKDQNHITMYFYEELKSLTGPPAKRPREDEGEDCEYIF